MGLRKAQLQQDAGLLRIERAGRHKAVLVVVDFRVLGGGARGNARASHNGDTVLGGLFKHREDGLMDVAVTDTGAHDAFVAGVHKRLHLHVFHAAVVIDDTDLRELREVIDLKGRLVGVLAQGLTFVGDLVVEDRADLAEVAGDEGIGLHGVGLQNVTGTDNDVVHRNDNTLFGRRLRGSHEHGVIEVARTVRTETGRRKHCAHEHHGLLAAQREVEEIPRFFHRVRAVRDHKAVILATVGVDGLIEFEPDVIGHVLRTDLHDLLGNDVGDFGKLRNSSHQVVHRDLARGVRGPRCGITGAGNRAARGEHGNVGQAGSRNGHAGSGSGGCHHGLN